MSNKSVLRQLMLCQPKSSGCFGAQRARASARFRCWFCALVPRAARLFRERNRGSHRRAFILAAQLSHSLTKVCTNSAQTANFVQATNWRANTSHCSSESRTRAARVTSSGPQSVRGGRDSLAGVGCWPERRSSQSGSSARLTTDVEQAGGRGRWPALR